MPIYNPAADGWTIRPSNPFMQSIGTLWERTQGAKTSLGIVCEARHDNGFDRMHGAVIATIADQALALAAVTSRNLQQGATCTVNDQVTIHLDIHFLRGVGMGDFLFSDCELTRETPTLSFVRGLLRVGDAAVCSAQGTFKLLNRKAG